jgi:hypothetical protein
VEFKDLQTIGLRFYLTFAEFLFFIFLLITFVAEILESGIDDVTEVIAILEGASIKDLLLMFRF